MNDHLNPIFKDIFDRAVSIARDVNPKIEIQDRGDWIGLGRLYNIILPDGRQTSVVVGPYDDKDKKIQETVGRFEKP